MNFVDLVVENVDQRRQKQCIMKRSIHLVVVARAVSVSVGTGSIAYEREAYP